MCAITGIVAPGPANEAAVRAMTDRLRHRGPDGSGLWRSTDGRCVFGHRRLAIIDLSATGQQPMQLTDHDIAVTYNGEIYNYLELRERLQARGHRFRSHSDTEVLLRAYVEWGDEFLSELNGMFAFALWDGRVRQVLCARDRFGEKPFLYTQVDGAFAFASEAKALGLLRGLDASIDDGLLAWYAHDSTWIDASKRTLVRGIQQLLPAHALRLYVGPDRVEVLREWCYWGIDYTGRHGYGADDSAHGARQLYDLLADSVRLRLRSDVPVGSCLSGGLDSSAVVSLMRRLEPTADIRTFTGRFPGHKLDEGHFARLVVERNRTVPSEVTPTPERFEKEAGRLYWHADFPLGGMSQFAQWCVFQLAAENSVTVLLDGQGSDEQLAGYGSAIVAAFLDQLGADHRWLAWLKERRAAAREAPELFSWPRLALNRTPLKVLVPALRFVGGRGAVTRSTLFHRDWLEASRALSPYEDAVADAGAQHKFSRTLWQLSFRTMLSSLLRYGDRLSMAHSREVRLPFCDHRIAELTFAMAPDLLVGDGQAKRVLRLAIQGLVPDEIAVRPKQGFIPPQDQWLLHPLHGWACDLEASAGNLVPALNRDVVRRIVRAPLQERSREVTAIWTAANLLAWARHALEPLRKSAKHDLLIGQST